MPALGRWRQENTRSSMVSQPDQVSSMRDTVSKNKMEKNGKDIDMLLPSTSVHTLYIYTHAHTTHRACETAHTIPKTWLIGGKDKM